MTAEERYQEFVDDYKKLVNRTGFQIAPAAGKAKPMASNWLISPDIQIEAVEGWQPPIETAENDNTQD